MLDTSYRGRSDRFGTTRSRARAYRSEFWFDVLGVLLTVGSVLGLIVFFMGAA